MAKLGTRGMSCIIDMINPEMEVNFHIVQTNLSFQYKVWISKLSLESLFPTTFVFQSLPLYDMVVHRWLPGTLTHKVPLFNTPAGLIG